MDGESELNELQVSCLGALEEGGSQALEALLAGHPDHAERLRSRLSALQQAGLIDNDGAQRPLPERLGEFRLLERLGSGGMGVVYLAEQESLRRRVALKLIRPDHLHSSGARARFRREVDAVARLAHPGIVPVHAVGEERGIPYFAMEYVEGASLDVEIRALRERGPGELQGRGKSEGAVRVTLHRALARIAELLDGS